MGKSGTCVLLIVPIFNTSLLKTVQDISDLLFIFISQLCNQLFLQKHLITFSGKWCLDTKIRVIGVLIDTHVIASRPSL